MHLIARRSLREFWIAYPDAEESLRAWCCEVEHAMWRSSADVKAKYRSASFIAGNRVVFNIRGNRYRLIVAVNYAAGVVFVKFIGTHAEYDRINAETVEWKPRS